MPIIQVDSRGAEVMRILPKIHEDVNEEWISDKSRHAFDGNKRQRLNVPMIKDKDGNMKDVSWDEALVKVAEVISKTRSEDIASMIGDQADVESITALRDLLFRLGVEDIEFKSVKKIE